MNTVNGLLSDADTYKERIAVLELEMRFSLASLRNTLSCRMEREEILSKVRQAAQRLEEALKQNE